MGDQISGIYPTIIIILVYMQRSISDNATVGKNLSNAHDANTNVRETHQISTLRFTPGQTDTNLTNIGPNSTVIDESSSQQKQENWRPNV
ncbi:hypothetical protein VNI00_013040 [Paramarasmius palmivorus]|uniref:Uncharacterized protein n=1 Tax=Paramarasmius palmivorus TaxID=297713 RepID=A0AAW0C2P0_9AGAR